MSQLDLEEIKQIAQEVQYKTEELNKVLCKAAENGIMADIDILDVTTIGSPVPIHHLNIRTSLLLEN